MTKEDVKKRFELIKNPADFFNVPGIAKLEALYVEKTFHDYTVTVFFEIGSILHELEYRTIVQPAFNIRRLRNTLRKLSTQKQFKTQPVLVLTANLSKLYQKQFIKEDISFMDLEGNIHLRYSKPAIYVSNCFRQNEKPLNYFQRNTNLFSDSATMITRTLLDTESETEILSDTDSGRRIKKPRSAFHDKASFVIRSFLHLDAKLRNKNIAGIDTISKTHVSDIIQILKNHYGLREYTVKKKHRNLAEWRALHAKEILKDWVSYYLDIDVEFRNYSMDKKEFLSKVSELVSKGIKIYASFTHKPLLDEEICHYVLDPIYDLDFFELNMKVVPNKDSTGNILVSLPVYKKSFNYGSYKLNIMHLDLNLLVLSQVQQLLDLARLVPGAEDEIELRIKEISNGIERKFYP